MDLINYIELAAGLTLIWFLLEEWRDRRHKKIYKSNHSGKLLMVFCILPAIIIGFLINVDESIFRVLSLSLKLWILFTAPLFIASRYQVLPFQLGEMKEK